MTADDRFLPLAEPDLGDLEMQYVQDAVRSGWVSSLGPYIDRFEEAFARFCEARYAVAVSSGTTALHLALMARGIGEGDEVIGPDLTFVATAAAVVHTGATPVLVDVDPVTWCIDPELVERAITPRSRAIIAVHLYGHPAEMTALRDIASRHGLFLLEDAAQAHGARYDGRIVGALGDASCFSFYGNKIVTTGEGGCITTDDEGYAARLRLLRDHAMSDQRYYFHQEIGFNYRMTNMQAALGCAQLERFSHMVARRQEILEWYREALQDSGAILNPRDALCDPVCWLVAGSLPGQWTTERLQQLMQRLHEEHRIATRPFFVPIHELPPYAGYRLVTHSPSVATYLSGRGLCLPTSTRMCQDDVRRVASALASVVSEEYAN